MNWIKTFHPIRELVTGASLGFHSYTLQGSLPGPTVYIQASLHGAELQGNLVIWQLLQKLNQTPFQGKITLAPLVNPIGVIQQNGNYTQGRFCPKSGDNWNRIFCDFSVPQKTGVQINYREFADLNTGKAPDAIRHAFKAELKKAVLAHLQALDDQGVTHLKHLPLTLQLLASDADIVLDLHTGPLSPRHLYVPKHCEQSAEFFDIPFQLIIPLEFAGAMDEATLIPWVRLSQVFQERNQDLPLAFESYTVELGSEEIVDSKEAEEDCLRVLNYLHHKGVWPKAEISRRGPIYRTPLARYRSLFAPCGGLLEYRVKPGQIVHKGEVLARIYRFHALEQDHFSKAITTIAASRDCIPLCIYPTAAISEGQEIMQVMEHYSILP